MAPLPPRKSQQKGKKGSSSVLRNAVLVAVGVVAVTLLAASIFDPFTALRRQTQPDGAVSPSSFTTAPSFDLDAILDDVVGLHGGSEDDDGRERMSQAGALRELMKQVKDRADSYENVPAESIKQKDPFGVRMAERLTAALQQRRIVSTTPTDEDECSCATRWNYAVVDLCLAVADLWFHLDDEPKHQAVLIEALRLLRPWSDRSHCDTDSVRMCEMRRGSIIEELIALGPINAVYRNMYGALLTMGLERHQEAVEFLQKCRDRFLHLKNGRSVVAQKKYIEQTELTTFPWIAPLLSYAKVMVARESAASNGEAESESTEGHYGEARNELCTELKELSSSFDAKAIAATTLKTVTKNVDPLIFIGLDFGDLNVLTDECPDKDKLQSDLVQGFVQSEDVGGGAQQQQ